MRIIGAFLWKSRRTSQSTLFIFISTENHIIIIWIEFMYQHLEKNLEDYADSIYECIHSFRYAEVISKVL